MLDSTIHSFALLSSLFNSKEGLEFCKEYKLDISQVIQQTITSSRARVPSSDETNPKKRWHEIITEAGMDVNHTISCYENESSFHNRFLLIEKITKRTEVTFEDLCIAHQGLSSDSVSSKDSLELPSSHGQAVHYSLSIRYEQGRTDGLVRLKHELVPIANNRIARKYGSENMINIKYHFPRANIIDVHKWKEHEIKSPYQLDTILTKLMQEFKPDGETLPNSNSLPFEHMITRSKIEGNTLLTRVISSILLEGFSLLGHQYAFLTCSQAGLFSFTFTCIRSNIQNEDVLQCREELIKWIFSPRSFHELDCTPIKLGLRMSLLLSTTVPTITLSQDQYKANVPDIIKKTAKKVYVLSDGCGRISPELATRVFRKCLEHSDCFRRRPKEDYGQNDMHVENTVIDDLRSINTPSAFQIRFQGSKGMLVVDHHLSGAEHQVIFPKSMVKFEVGQIEDDAHRTIEVMNFSRSTKDARMNHTLCHLISGCCRKVINNKGIDEILLKFCEDYYREKLQKFKDPKTLMIHCLLTGDHIGFNLSGFGHHREAILTGYFRSSIQNLKYRLTNSRRLYGVLDYTNTLKPGEVFICVDNQALDTDVLVTKEPATHRGDLIKLRAVKYESMMRLKDVIVFSRQSDRPDADRITGSDLDGDCFFVTWNSDIVQRYVGFQSGEFEPSSTTNSADTSHLDNDLPIQHTSHVIDQMGKDIVNRMTNQTTYIPPSDLISIRQRFLSDMPPGAWAHDRLWKAGSLMKNLSLMINQAIDAPKSGNWVDESEISSAFFEEVPKFPDFHPEAHCNNTQESKCIVGKHLKMLLTLLLPKSTEDERSINHFKIAASDYKSWYKSLFMRSCPMPLVLEGCSLLPRLEQFLSKVIQTHARKKVTIAEEIGFLSQFWKIYVMRDIARCNELYVLRTYKRYITPTKRTVSELFGMVNPNARIVSIHTCGEVGGKCLFSDEESGLQLYYLEGEDLARFVASFLDEAIMRLFTKIGTQKHSGSHKYFQLCVNISKITEQVNIRPILRNVGSSTSRIPHFPQMTGASSQLKFGLDLMAQSLFYLSLQSFFETNNAGSVMINQAVYNSMKNLIHKMDKCDEVAIAKAALDMYDRLQGSLLADSLLDQIQYLDYNKTEQFIKIVEILLKYIHHGIIRCLQCGTVCTHTNLVKCSCDMTFYCSKECQEENMVIHSRDCLKHKLILKCMEKELAVVTYPLVPLEKINEALYNCIRDDLMAKNGAKLKEKPCYERAYVLKEMGNIHFQIGCNEEALQWYQEAILLESDIRDVLHCNLSATLLNLHQYEQAIKEADLALQLNPKYKKANFRKDKALEALRAGTMKAQPDLNSINTEKIAGPDWETICANCKAMLSKQSRCSRCKQRYYCTIVCQKAHWNRGHKEECATLATMTQVSLRDLREERELPTRTATLINNMLGRHVDVPEFHKEYKRTKNYDLLLKSYERARGTAVSYERPFQGTLDSGFYFYMKRWGRADEQLFNFLEQAKIGDIFAGEKQPYSSQIFHSFRNIYAPRITFEQGMIHASVGIDLSLLLNCELKQSRETKPFQYFGFDEFPYTVAKSEVITSMMKGNLPPESILQVWFSSGWSQQTYKNFTQALKTIDESSMTPDVRKIIKHWQKAKPKPLQPEDMWMNTTDFLDFDIHYNLSSKQHRIEAIDYLLTGRIGEGSIPSICMFDNCSIVPRRSMTECVFSMLRLDIQINQSLMGSIQTYLIQRITKLSEYLQKAQVTIFLSNQRVTYKSIPSQFAQSKPDSVNWRNCCDYMSTSEFHSMARKLSGPHTMHSMHSTNWVRDVYGANIYDYQEVERNRIWNEAKTSTMKSLTEQALVYMRRPLLTHSMNITEYYLAQKHMSRWVDYYFPKNKVRTSEAIMLPFHAFPRSPCALYINFSYNMSK